MNINFTPQEKREKICVFSYKICSYDDDDYDDDDNNHDDDGDDKRREKKKKGTTNENKNKVSK